MFAAEIVKMPITTAPAVQRGQERIRLRVNANHTMDDLKNAILIFKVVLTKYGILNIS